MAIHYTSSSKAESLLAGQNFSLDVTPITAQNATVTLLNTDCHTIYVTGTTAGLIIKLPNATNLTVGHEYWILNSSTVAFTVQWFDGTNPQIINPGSSARYKLLSIATTGGTWFNTYTSSSYLGLTYAVTTGYGGSANAGRFLEFISGNSSDVSPFIVIRNSSIVALSMGGTANVAGAPCVLGIYKNGVFTNGNEIAMVTVPIGSSSAYTTALAVPVNQGDTLTAKIASGSINKPFVTIFIAGS